MGAANPLILDYVAFGDDDDSAVGDLEAGSVGFHEADGGAGGDGHVFVDDGVLDCGAGADS
ncbi:MAG: hypothetical protein CMM29_00590 [Rhodospirillaceae bacterium]|nr:hypothetical protein [Rhodospirillaceae bacterium]